MKATTKFFLALLAVSTFGVAHADETDTQVTASVLGNCQILSADDLNFGQLDPANATNKSATGQVSFACTSETAYTLSANNGQHFDATAGKRRMNNGANYLPYTLAAASFSGTSAGFGTPASHNLSASILGADYQDLPAAAFADTINLTLLP